MSVFASKQRERVELEKTESGKEQWIDLRRELTAGMRDYMYGRLYKRKSPNSDDLEIDVEAALSVVQTLEAWIVDWQVYDEDGEAVDLSPAALGALSMETSELVMQRINELRAERDARKKAGAPGQES